MSESFENWGSKSTGREGLATVDVVAGAHHRGIFNTLWLSSALWCHFSTSQIETIIRITPKRGGRSLQSGNWESVSVM